MTFLDIRTFLRTIFSYFLFGFVCIFFFVPALFLVAILPESHRYAHKPLFWLLDKGYKGIVWASLLPLEIIGKENIPQIPAIIAPNHQSAFDIPIVGMLLDGKPHIWFALEYYAQKPILGFFIRRIGVPVDRDNPPRAARALISMIRLAEQVHSHIIIFPEGTRPLDGKMHMFLQGFALLAKKSARPVVPVFMPNNGFIYPPGSFLVYWKPIRVVIGPSFAYNPDDTDETFTERVYAWFLQQQ